MGELPKNSPRAEAAAPYPPRTRLGERLLGIRQQLVASGERLLSWEELEQEVAERRGEPGGRG